MGTETLWDDLGWDYYERWLFTLEDLLFASDLLDHEKLQRRTTQFITLEQRSSVEA
jgi:hypothetical protein